VNREIPVIADSYVAILNLVPAASRSRCHDLNDFEIGLKYGLEQIKVIDEAGPDMNENSGPYRGLDRFDLQKPDC